MGKHQEQAPFDSMLKLYVRYLVDVYATCIETPSGGEKLYSDTPSDQTLYTNGQFNETV